jgi:quercetin dioxygenase-like cupin family protein
MKITHHSQFQPIDAGEIEKTYTGVTIRRVISDVDGAEANVMDIFEIAPGGQTPQHSHPWEHQIFVISGHGWSADSSGRREFREGDVIYVKPGESHTFGNSGPQPVKLVCVVPKAALTAYHLSKMDDQTRS